MANGSERQHPIHHPTWTEAESSVVLRALYTVASDGGDAPVTDAEEHFLSGTRSHILGHGDEVSWEPVIEPEEAAEALPDEDHRLRAAQIIAVAPFVDPMLYDGKLMRSRTFTNGLGVNMDEVAQWHDSHESAMAHFDRHHLMQEACRLRKLAPDAVPDYEDAQGKTKIVLRMLREAEGDPQEVERYMSLGDLPEGSLGRAFFDFYRVPPEREIGPDGKSTYGRPWPFPGDVRWVPEELTVYHDLIHVLNGYYIDVPGEFEVAGFTAGNSEHFPWLIGMLGFMPPYRRGNTDFDVDRYIAAFDRGKACTQRLGVAWDWWSVRERPIDELRREFGIDLG